MLPPVLEIFIVWHPKDIAGKCLAETIFSHFMTARAFSGLFGGGIQVSFRSTSWDEHGNAPRAIYYCDSPAPNGIRPARFVAVVPLLGTEMAATVEKTDSSWHQFLANIMAIRNSMHGRFEVYPFQLPGNSVGEELSRILGKIQFIATGKPDEGNKVDSSMLIRDLTQGITQQISPDNIDRLTIFISHTPHPSTTEGENVEALVELVREVISKTLLNTFFAANDLQPATEWEPELDDKSSIYAMLAVRTDLYSSRYWCQREIKNAKIHGMPVIMMDALSYGEERGSFLMDHVPRIAIRKSNGNWQKKDIYHALDLLVNECLKRAIWMRQKELVSERPGLDIAWWASHAPEPLTLSHWINTEGQKELRGDGDIRILHPDPPLGKIERDVLCNYGSSIGLKRGLDIMTPRELAVRGG